MNALLGGFIMGLLSVYLGNLISPTAARSVFVALNILLLIAVTAHLPAGFFREIIPTYQWLMLSVAMLLHENYFMHLAWMMSYAVIFYLLIYTQKQA